MFLAAVFYFLLFYAYDIRIKVPLGEWGGEECLFPFTHASGRIIKNTLHAYIASQIALYKLSCIIMEIRPPNTAKVTADGARGEQTEC